MQLPTTDGRAQVVGTWTMEWRWERRGQRMRATMVIKDSIVGSGWVRGMKGSLRANFRRDFEWTPPCVEPDLDVIRVEIRGDSVAFDFSPGCFDNNLVATLRLGTDTLKGEWRTWYFSTPPSAPRGSVRMWRRTETP